MSVMIQIPQAIADLVEEINRDINYSQKTATVEAYLAKKREDHEDWRLRILDLNDVVMVDHLDPSALNRHNVSMFLRYTKEYGGQQFRLGAEHAVNTLHEINKRALGLG